MLFSLVKVLHLLLRAAESRQVFKTKKSIYWGGIRRLVLWTRTFDYINLLVMSTLSYILSFIDMAPEWAVGGSNAEILSCIE